VDNGSEKVVEEKMLFILVDKSVSGMIDYFRNYGINVSNIYTDISKIRDKMLMQFKPTLLVIIDAGTGKFTSMNSRKALVDLLGICDGDNKVNIFYTDGIIKEEITSTSNINNKSIKWYKYRSTPDVLANILQYKLTSSDEFILDGSSSKSDSIKTSLDSKAFTQYKRDEKEVKVEQELLDLNLNSVKYYSENSDEAYIDIQGYQIKI
jgi:hypothetical protein